MDHLFLLNCHVENNLNINLFKIEKIACQTLQSRLINDLVDIVDYEIDPKGFAFVELALE